MRKILPVLLLLGLAACSTTTRWEKPGATAEMVSTDLTSCRQAAVQEANRSFPYYPWGWGGLGWGGWGWGYGPRNWMLWQMRADSERFYAENRLAAFCMRTKGYEQVEVRPPQTQAPPPPPPPPSPEPPLPK